MDLSPDAKSAWVAFYNRIAESQEDRGDEDPMRAALAKLEAAAARIALILCLTRWAYANDTDEPTHIQMEDTEGGIAIARYFAVQAERIYAQFHVSNGSRAQHQLMAWIEKRGGTATVRDLSRGPTEYRREAGAAESALESLVRAGHAWRRWVPSPTTGGHSHTSYELRCSGDGRTRPSRPPTNGAPGERVSQAHAETPAEENATRVPDGAQRPGEGGGAAVGDGDTRPGEAQTDAGRRRRVSPDLFQHARGSGEAGS